MFAIEFEHVVSCCPNSKGSGLRVLSHDAVFHNARLNFAIVIAKNCSPMVLAMELDVEKEFQSLLTDATVDDLYNWDPRTACKTFYQLFVVSLTMDHRPILLDKSVIWVVFWRRENGLL